MNTPRRYVLLYFAITIPLAWLFWVPMILIQRGQWTPPFAIPTLVWSSLGAVSPLVALAILQRVSGKQVHVDAILRGARLKEWRSRWVITSAFFSLGLTVLLVLVYYLVQRGQGLQTPLQVFRPDVFATLGWFILLVIPIHFFAALITSPLFEEPGWRGFAFEQLSRRLPRDVASLLVGSYWWLWHQGMNLAFDVPPTVFGFLAMLLDSFAIDALYTLSRRNLLAALLAHQSMGTANVFLFAVPSMWYLLAVKLVAVGALRLLVYRQARATPAGGAGPADLMPAAASRGVELFGERGR